MELRSVRDENVEGMPDLRLGTVHHANGLGYLEIQKCGSTSIQAVTRQFRFKTEVFKERPDLFLFTMIRHPLPRLVSGIVQYSVWTHINPFEITRWMISNLKNYDFALAGHWMEPQSKRIIWPVDVVIPMEEFQVLETVFRTYGFSIKLPHLQQTHSYLRKKITKRLEFYEDRITDIYREDYDLWRNA